MVPGGAMFGSDTLEAAIGLCLLFLVLSLTATSVREVIEGLLKTRAVHLERGIRELLADRDGRQMADKLYAHPQINGLFCGTYEPMRLLRPKLVGGKHHWPIARLRTHLPAYIPTRNFATALLDITARGRVSEDNEPTERLTVEQVRAGIARLPNVTLRRAMLVALDGANDDLDRARQNLEKWFDSAMDRVSGWYRSETQGILFFIGLVAAVTFNVDSVHIMRALHDGEALRSVIVAEASATVAKVQASGPDGAALMQALRCAPDGDEDDRLPRSCAQMRLEEIGLPIGWRTHPIWPGQAGGVRPWIASFPWHSVLGWLLTACAISLGAPFWFDVLNKVMVIRSTVKPHEKSPEESSEDRRVGSGKVPR